MKALRIERLGSREEFRFALHGEVDATGARAIDRVLFECQARGARDVTLDFTGVSLISTLGTTVIERQGRVYQETERRIIVKGLAGPVRAALSEIEAILYEENETTTVAAPPSDVVALQSKLRRKIVEFRNLFEITRALNLALDLDEVLNLFSLSVMGQFGVERLALFLTDPDREGILSPRQVRGFAQNHFRDFLLPPDVIELVAAEQTFFALGDGEDGDESRESMQALRQSGLEWGVELRVRRDLIGVLFIGGRSGRKGFQEDERDLLTILAHQGAVAIANARFYRAQEERNLGLVRGMMALIESRDSYAKGSTERVVRYVTAVARLLNYPKDQLKSLIYGAVLRDIGMITVSGLILKNPAHLSEDEWALIKQHPIRGAQILEEMNFPREVIEVVTNHHERWGGEGYPTGLKGHDIPLGARIVSLVDAYVAMTSERPYRRSLPYEKARQVIAENWGTPFDPAIVDVFLDVLEKIEKRSRLRAGDAAPPPESDPNSSAEPAALDPLSAGATIPVPSETRP
jgi:anti-anti-sigma regulatory factor